MNVRRIKRKCDVRGCRNTDVFSVSNVREHGRTVIICRDCIEEAYNAVKGYKEDDSKKGQKLSAPPTLFYHPEVTEPIAEAENEIVDVTEPVTEPIAEVKEEKPKKNKNKSNS